MDFGDANPIREILETPDNLDIVGAKEIKLTDASEFMTTLKTDGPQPEVYEYRTTILPDHEILPMSRVKDLVVSLCQDMEAAKELPEVKTMKLDEFRAWLIKGNRSYEEFFKKLPHLFRMIVSSKKTPTNLGHILKLIELRRSQENSTHPLETKQAQVSAYFREHFARQAKPGEEEQAVKDGTGVSGTPMTRDEVKKDLQPR